MAFDIPGVGFVVPRVEITGPGIHANPATPLRSIQYLLESNADHIMADMEDSIRHDQKGKPVREAIATAFNTFYGEYGGKVVMTFRPNNPYTEWHDEDLESVIKEAAGKFHGIIIPKTSTPEDVKLVIGKVEKYATQSGWTRPPQLEFLIETALGLVNVEEIARVLAESEIGAGLIFGIADFAASNGQAEIENDQSLNFLYAKQRVVTAAHAYGLHAIDNAWLTIPKVPREATLKDDYPGMSLSEAEKLYELVSQKNVTGLRAKNQQAALFGMDGAWAIHRSQVEIIKTAFTPLPTQIEKAEADVKEYFASGGGAGTVRVGSASRMTDTATTNIAITILGRAVLSGLYPKEQYLGYVSQMREVIGRVHHAGV